MAKFTKSLNNKKPPLAEEEKMRAGVVTFPNKNGDYEMRLDDLRIIGQWLAEKAPLHQRFLIPIKVKHLGGENLRENLFSLKEQLAKKQKDCDIFILHRRISVREGVPETVQEEDWVRFSFNCPFQFAFFYWDSLGSNGSFQQYKFYSFLAKGVQECDRVGILRDGRLETEVTIPLPL